MSRLRRAWTAEDIKAAVRRQGVTLYELARRHRLDPSTVTRALRCPCPAGARAISGFLGVPMHVLWPHWYDADGKTIPGSYRDIGRTDPVQRQKSRVA